VQTTALLAIVILLLMLSFVVVWPFSEFIEARVGWLAYPLIAIGLFVVLFGLYFVGGVMRCLIGMWRMSNPGHALRVARACAREVGKETAFGPATVYVLGPTDPTLMLKGQMETCRARFESLASESVEIERPLRFYVFGKRNAFDAFFRRAFLYGSNLDGMYIPWSTATISITTEFPAYRLADPERVARLLLSYYLLDTYRKCPSPLWLQAGIANVLACGADEQELARLNRRMHASVSRGTMLGTADLFHANPRAMIRLVRDWQDLTNFKRCTQLFSQAWSVAEYLCGNEAPDDRRERFRGFLKEAGPKEPQEQVFQRNFDHDFDTLLGGWRTWVLDHGIGFHGPPPPHIRDTLLVGVIPIVQDHGAHPLERIQAIREMGRAGYVLGADALIEILDADDQIPREEVIWSLEAISGLVLGADPKRWADWWDGLPQKRVNSGRAKSSH